MRVFTILFACLATIASMSVQAQFKQIAEGPEFEEPVDGYAKIIQLKNGSVFYLHVTMKDGVNVRIYDPKHAEKKATSFQPSYGELNEKMRDKVMAAFEAGNNEVVIFVYHTNEGMPTLYRLIVDGTTGKLKQQKAISVIEKEWKVSTFVTDYVEDFFLVRKDLLSDCYAVITTDWREKDRTKRWQIVHYKGDHSEISRQWFVPTAGIEGLTEFEDLVVMGSEKLLAFAYVWNKDSERHMLVEIKKGSMVFNELNLQEGQKYNSFNAITFNPITKKLLLLTTGALNRKELHTYTTNLYMIDPDTRAVQPVNNIGLSEKSQDYYKDKFNEKKGFGGLPQNVQVNADGGFTILYEDMYVVPSSGMGVKTSLEAVGAVTFDKDGTRISDYVIPKSQWISHKSFYMLYKHREELAAIELFESNQYKSFVYLDAGPKKFILFNDTEKNNNINRIKLGQALSGGGGMKGVTELNSINPDTDAFMYQLAGDDAIPKREYVFEEKDNIRAMALLQAAAYDPATNNYITLRFDKKTGRGIMAKMVWLEVK